LFFPSISTFYSYPPRIYVHTSDISLDIILSFFISNHLLITS
jgi:hypothetical protein